MLTNSLPKTKLTDPYILSLVNNIGKKKSLLKNLECINLDSKFSNIIGHQNNSEYFINNEFHKAKGFRKLHVEIAQFSGTLKILHCVFFPDPFYDIPIFGMDLVKVRDNVTAAIVDLSPVSNEFNDDYQILLNKVNKDGFSSKRNIPEWGEIFSNNVFFASLKNKSEEDSFYQIVDQYLSILLEVCLTKESNKNKDLIEERIYYQKRYCSQQMKNDKTSVVLKKYFDQSWVDNYIREILFDF